jgi:hypothetical protein
MGLYMSVCTVLRRERVRTCGCYGWLWLSMCHRTKRREQRKSCVTDRLRRPAHHGSFLLILLRTRRTPIPQQQTTAAIVLNTTSLGWAHIQSADPLYEPLVTAKTLNSKVDRGNWWYLLRVRLPAWVWWPCVWVCGWLWLCCLVCGDCLMCVPLMSVHVYRSGCVCVAVCLYVMLAVVAVCRSVCGVCGVLAVVTVSVCGCFSLALCMCVCVGVWCTVFGVGNE